jgi:N-acetylmuramoyl-L-alanine amidase
MFRSVTQPAGDGIRVTIDAIGSQTDATPQPQTPAPTELPPLDLTPDTATLRTVAIDAGHGGDDGGARGSGGTLEKDITLAVARRLKAALEGRLGLRVIMTRDDDRLVPIESRAAQANNNKADLFISLHANASFRPEVTGAVVYVASFNAADLLNERLGTERLPVFGGGLRTVEIVRWNMAQISHRAESEQLAQAVAESFTGRVPLGSNAIERAPLRLLESANMPAVLVEMGYLTNTEQEQALTTPELQNAVASALFDGVLRFREGNATRTSPAKAR